MHSGTLYRLIALVVLAVAGSRPAVSQLQFPGKPLADPGSLKAAEVIYVLPPVDPMEVDAVVRGNAESHKKPLRFALLRPLNLAPDRNGAWQVRGGYRVWSAHIVSPGALSIGILFTGYRLEDGVNVFVYDPDRTSVKGAFTSGNNKASGILPIGHIPGDEVVVELQVPGGLTDFGRLEIGSVSHAVLPVAAPGAKKDVRFGRSQDCEIDIGCEEGDDWQLHKRSVVRIFTSTQYCTGVVVNNSSYDGTPYILTSEHCINRPEYADASVFAFNYESPSCFGGDGSVDMSIAGCDTVAVGDSIDFSLVRLSGIPPDSFGVYYAGWDLDDSQGPGNTTIHHPEGDVKKITFDEDAADIPGSLSDIPKGDLRDYFYFSYWWIKQWEYGTTEGGSSGSPLFNSAGRMTGILTGGYARCGDSIGYDEESGRVIYNQAFNKDDFYTRLDVAWEYYGESGPNLKSWLDPGQTGVRTIGGYFPSGVPSFRKIPGKQFTVYPNPASGILKVEPAGAIPGPVGYRLVTMAGIVCKTGTAGLSGTTVIETNALSPGIYFLYLDADPGTEIHKVILTP